MKILLNCVAETLAEMGVRRLMEEVPGGGLLFDMAQRVYDKYRGRCQDARIQRQEVEQLANAQLDAAQNSALEAVAEVSCSEEDKKVIQLYLAQIPGSIRQSQKRSGDPSGRTLRAEFSLASGQDLAKLLPPGLPKFVPGDALPGADWTLKRLLGVGGFGEVWLAQNDHAQQDWGAVKFCHSGHLSDHEVQLIGRLMKAGGHPNIVRLLQARTKQTDEPWLMYEYIEGGDLGDCVHSWSNRVGIVERQAKVIATLSTLAEAIGYFHGLPSPIVHRDLKPANILRDKQGKLYITDFGIGGVAAQRQIAVQGMTTTAGKLISALYGSHTPLYAPPQQAQGDEPDPRDDVHALGVIGYQLLTGQMSRGPAADFVEDLTDLGVSEPLIGVLKKCVSANLERRFRNGDEIVQALHSLQKPVAPVAKAPPPKQPLEPKQEPKPELKLEPKPEPKPAPKQEQPSEPKPAQPAKAEEQKKTLWNLGGLLGGSKAEAQSATPQDRISGSQPKTYTEPKTGMEFIWVEGGRFQMGEGSEAHWVKVDGFYMAKYPITQGQWQKLMGNNPSNFKKGADYPVENISWEDVVNDYLPKLNKLGNGVYGLPTEAQWEYAARSGGKAETYSGGENLDAVGWYSDNSGSSTHPVGKKKPNGLGLCDMSGNVLEWCQDWYDSSYYRSSPEDNPQGPDSGSCRVLRGGGWRCAAGDCRAARRGGWGPGFRGDGLGARLVRRP